MNSAPKLVTEADAESETGLPQVNRVLLLLDLFMVGLILFNIAWILFDSAFKVDELRGFMAMVLGWLPDNDILGWYGEHIHPNFYQYDLVFVAIFATELVLRWGYAIWQRQYGHWLAYPVIHWYDVLGCIPIGELRLLRLLRLFAVGVRLQKVGIINVRNWWIYKRVMAVYSIIMEEVSDRVVIRVLTGVQDEMHSDHQLQQQVIDRVVKPRQRKIIDRIGNGIAQTAGNAYSQHQVEIERYVKGLVSEAVHNNREIRVMDKMPLVGGVATGLLDHAITDIVCRVIEQGVSNLGDQEFQGLFDSVAGSVVDALTEGEFDPDDEISDAVIELLDVIKAQVARRQWLEK